MIIVIGSVLPSFSLRSIACGGKQHIYNYALPNHGWLIVMVSTFQPWCNGIYKVVIMLQLKWRKILLLN